jgi:hypothetical protein
MENLPLEQYDYPTILLALSFVSYVWIRFRFSKRLSELGSAFVSNRFISQILREENPFLNVSSVVLYLNYILNAALFVSLLFQVKVLEHTLFEGLSGFLFVVLLLFLFDMVKLFSYWGSAFVFQTEGQTSQYVLYLMSSRQAAGLLLFLLNLLLAYSPLNDFFLAFFALGLVLILSIHRMLRSVPISQNLAGFNIMHFILYICALEISPILLGGKIFLNN